MKSESGSVQKSDCPMGKKYDLTILVPVYNEEVSLPTILKKIENIDLPNAEVIIVNDGSADSSKQIIEKWAKKKNLPFQLRVQHHPKNKGKGAAIQTGLSLSEGRYFVIQDADLEYEPAEIPVLLQAILEQEAPVIYGSRFMGSITDMPRPNYYANRFYNILVRTLYGVKITDMHTCYKMIETDLFKELNVQHQGFGYAPEVISKLLRKKVPIIEIPISYTGRTVKEGKKINARDGWECLTKLIKYRFADEATLFDSEKTL
jgi:glycosyltransferase involved in cell wall biosynthesis